MRAARRGFGVMEQRWILTSLVGVVVLVALVVVRSGGRASAQQATQTPAETAAAAAAAAAPPTPPSPRDQPIAFPHDVHAGQYKIDCQYCHYSAERSVDAGLPSLASCMGCHQFVGRSRPGVQQLLQYWERREPIPWVRIYKIPDHAHFPHMRHVAGELQCQECHGPVQEMKVVTLNQPLTMGWCVNCHRERDARTDCTVCHY
ncbi:MAG: cytochrome c3 family protein [Gemmatimonadetes bacterium]|nr:cytochrome c3 family protein [Gemmatimonadota bacterium]